MSESDINAHNAKVAAGRKPALQAPHPVRQGQGDRSKSPLKAATGLLDARNAPSTPRRAKEPNCTERDYAGLYLEPRRLVGEIARYEFEALTLVLPGGVRYTPDWFVVNKFGRVELHEIKGGYTWDDAIVKLKIAAALFPFRFTLAKKDKGVWTITAISA